MTKRYIPHGSWLVSDEDVTMIWYVMRRPGGLVGSKMLDRENHISVLAVKSLKLTAFMLKTLENCFRAYDIRCVNSRSVL